MKSNSASCSIQDYSPEMEKEWVYLRARIVARSHSWDFVERKKVVYENESVEIVGFKGDEMIGYIDAEIDSGGLDVCWVSELGGAVVQEFGVKPELHGFGYGKLLLNRLIERLKKKDIRRIEFWTKDPKAASIYQHWKLTEIFNHIHFRAAIPNQKTDTSIEHGYYITDKQLPENHLTEAPFGPHRCYGYEMII